jgi:ribonuclease T2
MSAYIFSSSLSSLDLQAVYYFRRAVELHKQLDTYAFLAAAGIYPSLTQTYTLEEITNAVQAGFGGEGEANIVRFLL